MERIYLIFEAKTEGREENVHFEVCTCFRVDKVGVASRIYLDLFALSADPVSIMVCRSQT